MDCTIEEEEDILKSPKKSNGEIMQWPYDHHGYCKIYGAAIGSPYCESLYFSGCRGGHRIILLSEIDMLLTSMVSLKILTSQFFIFIYLFIFFLVHTALMRCRQNLRLLRICPIPSSLAARGA